MKQLNTHQTKEFRPLTMVGLDFERIVETLSLCKDVRLVADDIEYDSVEEFLTESRGKAPSTVRITAREPYLTIEFYRTSARLYVSTSDLTGLGLFAKLTSQIQSCERQPWFLYSFWYAGISSAALQLLFTLPALKQLKYLEVWFVTTNFIWVLWVIFVQVRRFSLVLPIATQDPRSFWQRNSDNAIVAVFSAVLGAVGGVAATKMSDRIWPTNSNAPPAQAASSANAASSSAPEEAAR